LEINLEKNSLLPIIGVNECGKTTILHAILAFDYFNDKLNGGGRHLQDIQNLYRTNPRTPTVTGEIAASRAEIKSCLKVLAKSNVPELKDAVEEHLRKRIEPPKSLIIRRDLKRKFYFIDNLPRFDDVRLNNALAKQILKWLPYILYFDDFQDTIEECIEIPQDPDETSDWLDILQTLFQKTDRGFSVFELKDKEDRQRKSILSKVKRKLNGTLTAEWANFRLDDTDALEISIEFHRKNIDGQERYFLKFEIVEKDADGDEHYFFVRDRSKGFYWFFNFVMKLEFNPKVVAASDVAAIYVLDEPGSYLHAVAQERLCKKLRQLSSENKVVYCTHSHHLLNPEVIPLNTIRIAEKDANGAVTLQPIHEHKGSVLANRSAYQPVMDALQIRPFAVDVSADKVVLLVEGIIDDYLFDMFRGDADYRCLPAVGAPSMIYYISLLIAWRVPYKALWDNDDEGRKQRDKAEKHFGSVEAARHFALLPRKTSRAKNTIIQDLLHPDDIALIKSELKLPRNTSFDKTVSVMYFDPDRDQIIRKVSADTHAAFDRVKRHLGFAEVDSEGEGSR
jgi:hypothetical protein